MLIDHISVRNNRTALKYFSSQLSSKYFSSMVIETRHCKAGDPEPKFLNNGKLQLLSMRFCPYAQRTHIILEAKKIPYETININLTYKPEWLKKYSPLGKVPALGLTNEKGQPFIIESMVIADYLDEKYPEKLLYPKDPLAKAIDRSFIERFGIVTSGFHKIVKGNAAGLIDISNGLDEFEAELKKRGTPFYGGSDPGMLDYMIWPWIERLDSLKHGKENQYEIESIRFPALVEWSKKMIADPAVKVHYLTGDVHRIFSDGFKSKKIDYDILLNKSKM